MLQGICTYQTQLVPFGLFIVADGMGGHAFGQEASRLATQSIMQTVVHKITKSENLHDDLLIELLIEGVGLANQHICTHSEKRGKEMGTTITAALVVEQRAYIVNVGDSRTYLYRQDDGLSQITRDHSLVAHLVANGLITPEAVYTHPERNKVYRSVGNPDGVEVDWFTVDLHEEDHLLLCSDGLWEMVRDHDIERILHSQHDCTTMSNELVAAALHNGGTDNISVIVVGMS
jgi:serine/threonine protein phosphatase PrpC